MSNNNRNNNNNNNRRRGRGNNRSQGGGGQLNRIDSRARGNAPQLLEKYKKLAHDASLNGDRVQAEYYLQFADHYFRVSADSRTQKDDSRGPRREFDREGGADDDYFEDEFSTPREQPRHEQPRQEPSRQEPRGRREEPVSEDAGEEAPEGNRGSERADSQGTDAQGDEYENAENPFTRPARAPKQRRPRREREEAGQDSDHGNRLDPSALPGAIGRIEIESESEEEPVEERAEEAKPASRRGLKPRTRSRRTNDDDEELEAVG